MSWWPVAPCAPKASSPVIDDGFAFTGDYDGQFSCVDLKEGKITWSWKNEVSDLPFIASPSVYKNKVVIGNRDKYVYCFNKQNGTLFWKFNTGSRVEASPVISRNRVLTTNVRGDIISTDLDTGEKIWIYEIGSPIFSNPVL